MATLTEIENRNVTTVGSHIITDGQWAAMTHRHGCLHVSGAES